MNNIQLSFAQKEDEFDIKNLLFYYDLAVEDILIDNLKHFIIAKSENMIIGVIGIEIYNEIGLLRSFAVSPSFRLNGIGKRLFGNLVIYSYQNKINKLYLFTKNSDVFFRKLGFQTLNRNNLPQSIKRSSQYTTHCVKNVTCMYMQISKDNLIINT